MKVNNNSTNVSSINRTIVELKRRFKLEGGLRGDQSQLELPLNDNYNYRFILL